MARPRTPRRDARADRGASAVEYALVLAGVAAGLIVVLAGLQRAVETTYRATSADIAVISSTDPVESPVPPAPSTSSPAAPAPSPTATTPPATTPPATTPPATSTPSPSRPAGSVPVDAGDESDGVDIGWTDESKSFSATVTPSGSGKASIEDGELVFEPDDDTRGAVTVSWKFKDARGNWVSGTTTFWVTD